MTIESELEKMIKKNMFDAVVKVLDEGELELVEEVHSLCEAGYNEEEIESMIGEETFDIYKNSIIKSQTRYNELINEEDRAHIPQVQHLSLAFFLTAIFSKIK